MDRKVTSHPGIVLAIFAVVISVVVNGESCRTTGGQCIRNCDGFNDGNYQSCRGCSIYASCTAGVITDDRPCNPPTLVWDDIKGKCEYNSSTCHCVPYTTTVITTKPTTTNSPTTTRVRTTTAIVTSTAHHKTTRNTGIPSSTTESSDAGSTTYLSHLSTWNFVFSIVTLTLTLLAV